MKKIRYVVCSKCFMVRRATEHLCKCGEFKAVRYYTSEEEAGIEIVEADMGIIQAEQNGGADFRIHLEKQNDHIIRLASIGFLSAGLAHEINNPLTIIQGYLDLLEEDSDKKNKRSIELIRKNITRIINIVKSMMALSRKEQKEEIEVIDIHECIQESLKLVNFFKKEDITIVYDLNATNFMVKANTGKIQQVLLNLFINAKEALKTGGEISIETFNEDNSKLVIQIKDNGIGISTETLASIFDPFFTTKEGGTGLGLAISNGIIKSFGGELSVSSNQNKGSTFTIVFPFNKEEIR
jgi:two-component system NtrC family sensor kinase